MPKARDESTKTTFDRRNLRIPSIEVVVETPSGASPSAPLDLEPLVLGTSPECAIEVDDPEVSRHHCALALGPRGVVVTDLDSKNGCWIGGVEIAEAILSASATLQIGRSFVRLRVSGESRDVPLHPGASFGAALGGSLAMRALFAYLARAAQTDETILLRGESGTGKEVLARAVHDASPRKDGPFVVFDAGSVAPALVESELFGHARGAFTGATDDRRGVFVEADGGTLLIDEIGELPLDLQPRLLRALESRAIKRVGDNDYRPFDARIVAATHRDLRRDVIEGRFREDLFFRLAVIEARVPPLRERKEDIEILAERFLASETPARTLLDLPPGAMGLLGAHDWPGNVRELRNAVRRMIVFSDLGPSTIGFVRRTDNESPSDPLGGLAALPWKDAREQAIDRFEAAYLEVKLRESGGHPTRAAEAMGVSRQLLHRLVVRHGLRAKD